MSVDYNEVPLSEDGDWIDAAWLNQYLRDNFRALWKIQAAEDLIVGSGPASAKRLAKGDINTLLGVSSSGILGYRTLSNLLQNARMVVSQSAEDLFVGKSGTTIKRLAKGGNGTFLGVNSSGNLAYSFMGVVTAQKADTTGHSYNSTTWRDMPNSSATIVLPAGPTYTIQVTGLVVNTAPTQNYGWRDFQVRINGVDVGVISSEKYQINEGLTTPVAGMATGVPAGTRTIVLRERAELGEYDVSRLYWHALATAEPA
jgi:hypothetical protein